MAWEKSAEDRKRDAKVYQDPVYVRNRAVRRRMAGGRCEQCGHPHGRLECDHIIPASQGGGPEIENLRMLCKGVGTCKCHEAKTAQEGGGYRKTGGNRAPSDPEPEIRTKW